MKKPEKDDFYLFSEIKKIDKNIKTIVLIANSNIESVLKATTFRVDEYILKPFNFYKLLLTIRKVLQKNTFEIK